MIPIIDTIFLKEIQDYCVKNITNNKNDVIVNNIKTNIDVNSINSKKNFIAIWINTTKFELSNMILFIQEKAEIDNFILFSDETDDTKFRVCFKEKMIKTINDHHCLIVHFCQIKDYYETMFNRRSHANSLKFHVSNEINKIINEAKDKVKISEKPLLAGINIPCYCIGNQKRLIY
jgi:hypothetical protein